MSDWATKLKAHSASKQAKPRRLKSRVYSTSVQTRKPNDETGDPGAVMEVYYSFDGCTVTLTDAKGVPSGGKTGSYVLQPGETALRIAKCLALAGMERTAYAPANAVAWVV